MDDIKKHCDKLKKAIDIRLGKGKGTEVLSANTATVIIVIMRRKAYVNSEKLIPLVISLLKNATVPFSSLKSQILISS